MQPVSFTVRRPTPISRPSSSGPESDGPFKIPALPRHLASASSSAPGSPLAGSPHTFSDSDDDGETGIVFANSPSADDASHHTDSSDEDSERLGQRCVSCHRPSRIVFDSHKSLHTTFLSSFRPEKKKGKGTVSDALLVIPTKPNPDWREAARRRRAACARVQPHATRGVPSFVPDSALAATGADGSVGGLGTRDTINSGPQISGLQFNKRVKVEVKKGGDETMEEVSVEQSTTEVVEESEDQRALRAILAGEDDSVPVVEIIPVPPLSEADALKQDVQELPDVATAQDYERVPISAFGAAMLRGMGWTDGAVASKSDKRRKNGLTELYLPQARTALLGIGAKEQEAMDDGSGKKKRKGADMRYIPVARKESGRGEDASSRSGSISRRSSRSPSRKEGNDRGADPERSAYDDRERERRRDRNRDYDESKRRTKDYDETARERKDYRDRDRDQDRSDVHRDRERGGKGKGKEYEQRDRTRERDRRDRRDDR